MFWRTRSPLEVDDEEWQLECWHWLLQNFGGLTALRERQLVLPTYAFFEPAPKAGHAAAVHYFRQTCAYFDVDPDGFLLEPQAEEIDPVLGPMQIVAGIDQGPAGTFSVGDGNRLLITYSPKLTGKPMQLIATFAHEICHPLLLETAEPPPGGDDMEEFATDLAMTFFGFGVFNANTAATFRQFSDAGTGTQGWSFERQGYLSPAERAFALALFMQLRGESANMAESHLEAGAAAYFRKSAKYLASRPSIASELASRQAET